MTKNSQNINRGDVQTLRSQWKQNNIDSRPVTAKDVHRMIIRNNYITRLRRRAFMLFILGLTGAFWMWLFTYIQPVSLTLRIVYISLMFIAGIENLYWWFRLGQVYDYMSIPVIEAQYQMDKLDRLRRNIKISGWILGTPVIALLFYEVGKNGPEGSLTGAIIGAVIGGTIGLTIEYLNRKQIKAIKKSFAEESEISDLEA